MKKTEGLWCLEYSTEQNCFHVDLLERTLETNLKACLNKNNNDYQIVFIGSRDDCSKLYYELKERIKNA